MDRKTKPGNKNITTDPNSLTSSYGSMPNVAGQYFKISDRSSRVAIYNDSEPAILASAFSKASNNMASVMTMFIPELSSSNALLTSLLDTGSIRDLSVVDPYIIRIADAIFSSANRIGSVINRVNTDSIPSLIGNNGGGQAIIEILADNYGINIANIVEKAIASSQKYDDVLDYLRDELVLLLTPLNKAHLGLSLVSMLHTFFTLASNHHQSDQIYRYLISNSEDVIAGMKIILQEGFDDVNHQLSDNFSFNKSTQNFLDEVKSIKSTIAAYQTKSKTEEGKSAFSLFDLIAMRKEFTNKILTFLSDLGTKADDSFDKIEQIAREFHQVCRIISDSSSVEDAKSVIRSFEVNSLYSGSLCDVISLVARNQNSLSVGFFDFESDLDLKSSLASLMSNNLPGGDSTIGSFDSFSHSTSLFSHFSHLRVSYVPTVNYDLDGRIRGLDQVEPGFLTQAVLLGGSSTGFSPRSIFKAIALKTLTNDSILKMVSGASASSEIISDIQFPVFIKDVLLTKIRSMSMVIEIFLNCKRIAGEIWADHFLKIGQDIFALCEYRTESESRLLNHVAVKESWDKVKKIIDECAFSSRYPIDYRRSQLPFVNFDNGNNNESFGFHLSKLITSKGVLHTLVKNFEHLFKLFIDETGREAYNVARHNHVVQARKLRSYDFLMDALGVHSVIAKPLAVKNLITNMLVDADADLIRDNVIKVGESVGAEVSFKIADDNIDGEKNLFGDENLDQTLMFDDHKRVPSTRLVELANSLWKSSFSSIVGDDQSHVINSSKFLMNIGPVAYGILRFAQSPLEGIQFGMAPIEATDTRMRLGHLSEDEKLELVLSAVGLHSAMQLSQREASFVIKYVRSSQGSRSFPLSIRPDATINSIRLRDIVALNESFLDSISSFSSASYTMIPTIFLRENEYLDLLFSDRAVYTLAPKLKFISDENDIDSIYFERESEYFLEVGAFYDFKNPRFVSDADLRGLAKRVISTIGRAMNSLVDREDFAAPVIANSAEKPDVSSEAALEKLKAKIAAKLDKKRNISIEEGSKEEDKSEK